MKQQLGFRTLSSCLLLSILTTEIVLDLDVALPAAGRQLTFPLELLLSPQACLIVCDPTDCSPPGSSVQGDSPGKNTGPGCHALLLRGSPQPRDPAQVSGIAGGFFTIWAAREAFELAPHLRLHPATSRWTMIVLTNTYQKYGQYFYGPFCWTSALSKCKYIWISFFIWHYANT